jgi:hypothetical protein
MIIRNPPSSRSGFSRLSFSAFLGGYGTRILEQRVIADDHVLQPQFPHFSLLSWSG